MSVDDKHRSAFVYAGAIPEIIRLLLTTPHLRENPELIALATNLAQNGRCVEVSYNVQLIRWVLRWFCVQAGGSLCM